MRLYKRIPDTDERGHTVVYEAATPSEIAQAHPKCETCEFRVESHDYEADGRCSNDESYCFMHYVTTVHYCPNHTALTGAPDETE